MPSRNYSSEKYRYGFNGKEKDKEFNSLSVYDFTNRIYDSRIGRWLSVDPLQQIFPNFSPYNYCYNNPLNVIDPDGKLGIYVEVKYDEKSGKYTIIKMTINDDLEPRNGGWGTNWFDFVAVYKNVHGDELQYSTMEPIQFKLLTKRFTTVFQLEWAAKAGVNDGVYEEGSGIVWTSAGQTSGSSETKKGKNEFMSNIDLLMTAISATKGLDDHPLEFDRADVMQNFLEKIAEIVKELSDKKPGEVNMEDPKIKASIEEMKKLLSGYQEKKDEINNQANTTNTQTHKRKTVIIRKPTTGYTGNVFTKSSQDPNGTDTIVYLYHPTKKPQRKPSERGENLNNDSTKLKSF